MKWTNRKIVIPKNGAIWWQKRKIVIHSLSKKVEIYWGNQKMVKYGIVAEKLWKRQEMLKKSTNGELQKIFQYSNESKKWFLSNVVK